jgi:hypothetical protein
VSWNITVNVVGGEARVFSQSGELPAETSIILAGHEDGASVNLSVNLTDEGGQRASVGSFARKASA